MKKLLDRQLLLQKYPNAVEDSPTMEIKGCQEAQPGHDRQKRLNYVSIKKSNRPRFRNVREERVPMRQGDKGTFRLSIEAYHEDGSCVVGE